MKEQNKGCLWLIASTALCMIGFGISMLMDWMFLRCLCLLLLSIGASYVGSTYFSNGKQKSPTQTRWTIYILLAVVFSALITWIKKGC